MTATNSIDVKDLSTDKIIPAGTTCQVVLACGQMVTVETTPVDPDDVIKIQVNIEVFNTFFS